MTSVLAKILSKLKTAIPRWGCLMGAIMLQTGRPAGAGLISCRDGAVRNKE